MAWEKRIAPGKIVWAFGRPYQWHTVRMHDLDNGGAVVPLTPQCYGGTQGKKYQTTKIMLHATGGNSPGENTLRYMINNSHYATHLIVERTPGGTYQGPRAPAPARAPRNAAKLRPDAVLDDGDNFVDVVQQAELYDWLFHGSNWNKSMIGIEHANIESGWDEGTLTDDTLTVPANKKDRRPQDTNRFYNLKRADARPIGFGASDYQAYQDAQYNSMILMLRSICVDQRIPRNFFGDTWVQKAKRRVPWKLKVDAAGNPILDAEGHKQYNLDTSPASAVDREEYGKLARFRGIIRHSNVHHDKSCPGIIAYNRLYRGISDEWWLPVELEGAERKYYSGPFWNPAFTAPDNGAHPSKPAWFMWVGSATPVGVTLNAATADIEALTQTQSYFDVNAVDSYYKHCESRGGGFFPIGKNNIWHGGVHLEPKPANPVVYAAASGTIVAARITSMKATDEAAGYGSQRFVLIRHAVYWKTEDDPNGPPSTGPDDPAAKRINYTLADKPDGNPDNPTYVFSLYMHLGPLADPYSQADGNPRWYNLWLRKQAIAKGLAPDADPPTLPPKADLEKIVGDDGSKGRVFNPDIEVSVGDVLGVAGPFATFEDPKTTKNIVHFEILSHKDFEISLAGSRSAQDANEDAACDVALITKEMEAAGGTPAKAAEKLRDFRVMHLSTWGWQMTTWFDGIALEMMVGDEADHIKRMLWYKDALAANPALSTQLGAKAMLWHYHPITFMAAINRLILAENREIAEAPWEGAVSNVELDDDYYLTDFFNIDDTVTPPVWRQASADNKKIEPYQEGKYTFTRADLACKASTAVPVAAHTPDVSPPKQTKFSLALLEIVERVRNRLNAGIEIKCAYICPGHTLETSRCCRDDIFHAMAHTLGIAVDIKPSGNATADSVKKLWAEIKTVCDDFNTNAVLHAGRACCANLPSTYTKVDFKAQDDAVTAKLNAKTNLSTAEARAFAAHIGLLA